MDISKTFTPDAKRVLEAAYAVAKKHGEDAVSPQSICFPRFYPKQKSKIFAFGWVFRQRNSRRWLKLVAKTTEKNRSDSLVMIFFRLFGAYEIAYQDRQPQVEETELLLATVRRF